MDCGNIILGKFALISRHMPCNGIVGLVSDFITISIVISNPNPDPEFNIFHAATLQSL